MFDGLFNRLPPINPDVESAAAMAERILQEECAFLEAFRYSHPECPDCDGGVHRGELCPTCGGHQPKPRPFDQEVDQ